MFGGGDWARRRPASSATNGSIYGFLLLLFAPQRTAHETGNGIIDLQAAIDDFGDDGGDRHVDIGLLRQLAGDAGGKGALSERLTGL